MTTNAQLKIIVEDQEAEIKHLRKVAADLIRSMKMMAKEVKKAQERTTGERDRGPESQGGCTDDLARRFIFGDLKDVGHKAVAKQLGLSYGQVYSARCGYTKLKVWKEAEDSGHQIGKFCKHHMDH